MKSINVRELRNEIPRLRELLDREHELLLVTKGQPLARILPVAPQRKLESLVGLRSRMPRVKVPSEVLVREDRDRRGS
jgi:antitoxin (DNA-binding transcriptional repressor) of toxin-antitoxin stability system